MVLASFFVIHKLSTYTPDIIILKIINRSYERKKDHQPRILLKKLIKSGLWAVTFIKKAVTFIKLAFTFIIKAVIFITFKRLLS